MYVCFNLLTLHTISFHILTVSSFDSLSISLAHNQFKIRRNKIISNVFFSVDEKREAERARSEVLNFINLWAQFG
jgi:hypothetical protein